MTLEERLENLERRVETLERDRWAGPPRLGPRPLTDQEEREIARRVSERIVNAVRTSGIKERTKC